MSGQLCEMKSCLLIVPRHFYWFEKNVSEALAARGYSVTVANDEYPLGTIGKILGKLQIPIVFTLTHNTLSKRFLKNRRYDLVLIFKGRGISGHVIKEIYQSAHNIIGFNLDSFSFNRSPLGWLNAVTRYCTFDYGDADRWSLPVIDLFSPPIAAIETENTKYELSAVMRNYGRRLRYVDRVIAVLRPRTVFIYLYELNFVGFVINALRDPRLYFRYRRNIHFRPLGYTEYAEVMRTSKFTIDYASNTQTGITIRCFEAVCAKTKIITNNAHIRRSRNFNEKDYIVFAENGRSEELVAAHSVAGASRCASHPRTVTDFLDELLAEPARALARVTR